jgi:hypothetical protein
VAIVSSRGAEDTAAAAGVKDALNSAAVHHIDVVNQVAHNRHTTTTTTLQRQCNPIQFCHGSCCLGLGLVFRSFFRAPSSSSTPIPTYRTAYTTGVRIA